jgi:hypothetical protein
VGTPLLQHVAGGPGKGSQSPVNTIPLELLCGEKCGVVTPWRVLKLMRCLVVTWKVISCDEREECGGIATRREDSVRSPGTVSSFPALLQPTSW